MKRFRVSGHSMLPTLQPGQEVVATDGRVPRQGDLVVFPDPRDRDLWLIKRLVDDTGLVASDNPADGSHDSRDLGPVSIESMRRVVERLDDEMFREACDLLVDEDPHLADLVEKWGLPVFWNRTPGFRTLVLLILEQQVSLESGAAMYARLERLTGDVTPRNVVLAGEHRLRSIGVTRQKTGYLLDLSASVVDGDLDLDEIEDLPDHSARDRLLSIRGVGPWTSDAYLLSASRRPDMWPVGDRGLQVGVGEALGMTDVPDEDELEVIAAPWRPVRAAAARLIWHSYLSRRGRVEPTDPVLVHGGRWNA